MTAPLPALTRVAATTGGSLLASGTRALASVRPARKPLHPDGNVVAGRVFRHGSPSPTGVAWLDEPGDDDAVVRISRAIGLPAALPDIHGLALRVHGQGQGREGHGDLLFASTGWGRVTRFMLTAGRRPESRPMTTLFPYRTSIGPLLLGARDIGTDVYELAWARPTGGWHPFAVLRLAAPHGDVPISFDPVRHQITGLEQYPALTRLREPSYLTARQSRHLGPHHHEEHHHVH